MVPSRKRQWMLNAKVCQSRALQLLWYGESLQVQLQVMWRQSQIQTIYIYILLSGRECALKPEAGQSTPRREPCADFRLQDGIFSNFGRVTMSKDSKDTKDVMFCTQSSPAHDRTTNLAL